MAENIVVSALLMNDSSSLEDDSEEEDSTNITAIALSRYDFFLIFKYSTLNEIKPQCLFSGHF